MAPSHSSLSRCVVPSIHQDCQRWHAFPLCAPRPGPSGTHCIPDTHRERHTDTLMDLFIRPFITQGANGESQCTDCHGNVQPCLCPLSIAASYSSYVLSEDRIVSCVRCPVKTLKAFRKIYRTKYVSWLLYLRFNRTLYTGFDPISSPIPTWNRFLFHFFFI